MTEEEARKKVCPFIRETINEQSVISDGHHPIVQPSNFCASRCMAWRWKYKTEGEHIIPAFGGLFIEPGKLVKTDQCYCGAING